MNEREKSGRNSRAVVTDSDTHFQAMLASIPDPISFVDRKYRYLFVNDAYAKYAKRPREEIRGLSIAELLGQRLLRDWSSLTLTAASRARRYAIRPGSRFPRNNQSSCM
jgi:PAS domain-containing protein